MSIYPPVLVTITEGDLQRPDFFRMIGCEVVLGNPKAKKTTVNYVVLLDLPKERTSFEVLNRLTEAGIGLISPHPITGAIQLLTIEQAIYTASSLPFVVIVESDSSLIKLGKLKPHLVIVKDSKIIADFQCPIVCMINDIDQVPPIGQVGLWLQTPSGLEQRCNLSFELLATRERAEQAGDGAL